MKKIISTLLAIVLLGAAAYSMGAWYMGQQIEQSIGNPFRQFESLPYIKIVKRDFKRGVFRSEETVTFELFGELTRYAALLQKNAVARPGAAEAVEPIKPLQFTLVSHIKHGPFQTGNGLAVAVVDSELEVDERLGPALARALGGKKLLTAHTVYSENGTGESIITSPVFVAASHSDGAGVPSQFSSGGMNATVRFAKDFASYSIQGEAPKFEFTARTGVHIELAGLRFAADGKRIFEDDPLLYAGGHKFALAHASIDGPALAGKSLTLNQVAYEGSMPLDGDFLDFAVKIGIQDVLAGESNYGPARLDYSARHLHGRTFAQMYRAILNVYADPAALSAGAGGEAVNRFMSPAKKLLEYNPQLILERLSFMTAQGEVVVSAQAKIDGVKPEDFDEPSQLLAKLEANADVLVPEELLKSLIGVPAGAGDNEPLQMRKRQDQIDELEEKGYIERDGAMFKSRLEFRNGQLTINGKPFDLPGGQALSPPTRQ